MNAMLSAGVARSDITPPIGIGHAGWGAQAHQRAVGVDLPLWATALAICDGREIFVIIDIDTMYLFEDEAAAVLSAVARLTKIPQTHIRLSYTHTHSGPLSGNAWSAWMQEGPEMIAAYDVPDVDHLGSRSIDGCNGQKTAK
jgi:O-methyltransferase involved in polyketide biosynthesis